MENEMVMFGADLVGSVGFPIGAFLLMYSFATKTLKENTAAIRDLCIAVKSKK